MFAEADAVQICGTFWDTQYVHCTVHVTVIVLRISRLITLPLATFLSIFLLRLPLLDPNSIPKVGENWWSFESQMGKKGASGDSTRHNHNHWDKLSYYFIIYDFFFILLFIYMSFFQFCARKENLCCLICIRHLITARAVKNRNPKRLIFLHAFAS